MRDFLLDAGAPSRSHRVVLFGADFAHGGSHIEKRESGYIVFYVHLSGYYACIASTESVSWVHEIAVRPIRNDPILLCSTGEENGPPKQKKQHLDGKIENTALPIQDMARTSAYNA